MGEKGDMDQFFLGIPNVNWPTEYRTRTITKKSYGLRAASPLRVAGKRASERRRAEETKSSHSLSPHLSKLPLVSSRFAGHSRVTSLGELARWLFHFCERWFRCHHNGSVNSKRRTHTPKRVF